MSHIFDILSKVSDDLPVSYPPDWGGEEASETQLTVLKQGASYSYWVLPANQYKNGANYYTLALANGDLTMNVSYQGIKKSVVVGNNLVDEHNRPSFLLFDDYHLIKTTNLFLNLFLNDFPFLCCAFHYIFLF